MANNGITHVVVGAVSLKGRWQYEKGHETCRETSYLRISLLRMNEVCEMLQVN